MLIYFLQWWPSWISDQQKKPLFCRGPSNDHFWAVWFQLSKWFQRRSVLKPLGQLKPNCPGMIIGRSSTNYRKSKMAATAIHRLTLDPMGKCSNAFFSETTNMIKAKLYMNVYWMVLYNLKVFCSDMKVKMAATVGLSLTLDPMGKMFQNASSLKPHGQLKPNCPGIIS